MSPPNKHLFIGGVFFLIIASFIFGVYSSALNFGFSFDDFHNLHLLGQLNAGTISEREFILSGHASSFGRPLSLWTFALQRECWPDSPECFILFNIWLHVINALLVFWLALQILSSGDKLSTSTIIYAAFAALAWALNPMLQSTTFMAIQRMASLSAFFTLLGLNGFVLILFRQPCAFSWKKFVLGTSVAAVAAGVGFLAKENAAVMPFYLLALTLLFINHANNNERGFLQKNKAKGLAMFGLMALPCTLIAGYLVATIDFTGNTFQYREFSSLERIMTEWRVLFRYLSLTLLPQPGQYGPLQMFDVSSSLFNPVTTFVAFFCWCGLLALALVYVRSEPALLFGLLWFLGGHIIEASGLNLELYFEHRNYLPSLGVYLCIALLLQRWSLFERKNIYSLASVAWLSIVIVVSYQSARIWADPLLAKKYWLLQSPRSIRALDIYVDAALESRDIRGAQEAINLFVPSSDSEIRHEFTKLRFECYFPGTIKAPPSLYGLGELIMDSDSFLPAGMGAKLEGLVNLAERDICDGVNHASVKRLLLRFVDDFPPKFNQLDRGAVHYLLAKQELADKNVGAGLINLIKAFQFDPKSEGLSAINSIYLRLGLDQERRAFLLDQRRKLLAGSSMRHKAYWAIVFSRYFD